jgi:hypothetical protein
VCKADVRILRLALEPSNCGISQEQHCKGKHEILSRVQESASFCTSLAVGFERRGCRSHLQNRRRERLAGFLSADPAAGKWEPACQSCPEPINVFCKEVRGREPDDRLSTQKFCNGRSLHGARSTCPRAFFGFNAKHFCRSSIQRPYGRQHFVEISQIGIANHRKEYTRSTLSIRP